MDEHGLPIVGAGVDYTKVNFWYLKLQANYAMICMLIKTINTPRVPSMYLKQ